MSDAVPLAIAAKALGIAPGTLRRWLTEGAPCAQPGEVGRGHSALVVVEDLEQWRAAKAQPPADPAAFLERLKALLADYHRAGDHRLVGLRDDAAQALYTALLEYVTGRMEMDR